MKTEKPLHTVFVFLVTFAKLQKSDLKVKTKIQSQQL